MEHLSLGPIRQAVSSGEFDKALLLWNECAAALGAELVDGRLVEARLGEVRELVEWSRTVVLCERAHLRDQLNSLHIAAEYESPQPESVNRLVVATF